MNSDGSQNLPFFVTAPGETDYLLLAIAILLVAALLSFGIFYLRLHHLPDHIAHKEQKLQLQIVGVLGLISMFTHNNLFWIAALLLALITIPDFNTPLTSIAQSLAKMADRTKATVIGISGALKRDPTPFVETRTAVAEDDPRQ